MTLSLRPARPGDEAVVMELIGALAPLREARTRRRSRRAEAIAAALFAEHPRVFCDLAEVDGAVVGFALWFYTFSTFRGRHGIWLEDLFVRPEARRAGAGTALLRNLARRCVAEGLGALRMVGARLERTGDRLLRGQGARLLDDWTMCRVDGRGADGARRRGRRHEGVAHRGGRRQRRHRRRQRHAVAAVDRHEALQGADHGQAGGGRPQDLRDLRQATARPHQYRRHPAGRLPAGRGRRSPPASTRRWRWRRRSAEAAGGDEVMVLGGGEIYAAAIGRADRLYITHVEAEPAGSGALSGRSTRARLAGRFRARRCRPARRTARRRCSPSTSARARAETG